MGSKVIDGRFLESPVKLLLTLQVIGNSFPPAGYKVFELDAAQFESLVFVATEGGGSGSIDRLLII